MTLVLRAEIKGRHISAVRGLVSAGFPPLVAGTEGYRLMLAMDAEWAGSSGAYPTVRVWDADTGESTEYATTAAADSPDWAGDAAYVRYADITAPEGARAEIGAYIPGSDIATSNRLNAGVIPAIRGEGYPYAPPERFVAGTDTLNLGIYSRFTTHVDTLVPDTMTLKADTDCWIRFAEFPEGMGDPTEGKFVLTRYYDGEPLEYDLDISEDGEGGWQAEIPAVYADPGQGDIAGVFGEGAETYPITVIFCAAPDVQTGNWMGAEIGTRVYWLKGAQAAVPGVYSLYFNHVPGTITYAKARVWFDGTRQEDVSRRAVPSIKEWSSIYRFRIPAGVSEVTLQPYRGSVSAEPWTFRVVSL